MTRLTMRVLAMVTVTALAASAHAADVHRWIEGNTVVYSDQPPQTDVKVVAPEAAPAEATPTPAPPEPTEPATVDEILELSGMRPQLPGIARALATEYLPRPGQLSERDAAAVVRVVAGHWAPERLYAALRDDFRRRVDARQLDAMAVWFRALVGRKVTALEIAASGPEAAPKIAAFAAGLKTSRPPAARLELVQRLDWVTGTSHETTDIALAIAGSIARAAAAAASPERRARAGLVERRVEEMRGQVGATIAEDVMTQMLYVYAPLSDDELRQYVDFLASPAGRAYGRAAHGALLRVVREVADRTAIDVVRAVPLQRWATAQKPAGPAPPR